MYMKLLSYIDCFGTKVLLRIDNDTEHHSICSGILSIILYIIGFICIIVFGLELVMKNAPSVNSSTFLLTKPSKMDYFDNYEIMISLQDKMNLPKINERIYHAEAIIYKTIVNSSGTYSLTEKIQLDKCSNAVTSNSKNYDLFKDYDLTNYYCLIKNETSKQNIYINDIWGHNQFQMIQFRLYKCNNETSSILCEDDDVIKDYLEMLTVSVYSIDNYVQTDNHSEPLQRSIKENFFIGSYNGYLAVTSYLHYLRIISDDGFIFTTKNKINTFQQDKLIDFTTTQKNDLFMSYTIQYNNKEKVYFRKYYKFQDFAAHVLGIYRLFMIIFLFINKCNSNHSYYEYMLNTFFYIKFPPLPQIQSNDNSTITKKSFRSKTPIQIDNPLKDNNIKQSHLTHNEINIPSSSHITPKKKAKDKFDLTFWDKLFMLTILPKYSILKTMRQDEVYNDGRNYLNQYLDIVNMQKSYHHLEVISHLMYSDNQLEILKKTFQPVLITDKQGPRIEYNNIPNNISKKLIPFQSCGYFVNDSDKTSILSKNTYDCNDENKNEPNTYR